MNRKATQVASLPCVQDADILLPTAAAFEFALLDPERAGSGFSQVLVTVDREDRVQEVSARISAMGYNEFSFGSFIDIVRLNVLMVTTAVALVAIAALVVAAVGITKTMIMSVLERTHEIGVMKAVGAKERHTFSSPSSWKGSSSASPAAAWGWPWRGWRRSQATRSPN